MSKVKLYSVMICAAVLAFCATGSFVGAGETISLKIGFVDAEAHSYVIATKWMDEELNKRTNGRLRLEIFHSGQLGNEREMYEGSQIGSIDICTVVNAVLSSFVPEMAVLDQPFLFDHQSEAQALINGKLGEMSAEKIRQQGVHVVGWFESDFRNVYCNRPVNRIEDFKGMKLRVMENPIQIGTWNAMGLIATPMSPTEIFTALQQRTIDGAEGGILNILNSAFYEVTRHVVYTKHLYSFVAAGVSDRAWNRIPDDLKPIFLQVFKEGTDYQHHLAMELTDMATERLKKEHGVTFHTIDLEALKQAIAPVMVGFRAQMDQTWLKVLEEELAVIKAKRK